MNELKHYICICNTDVEVNYTTWDVIREHVREYKPFFVIYNGEKYKYERCHEFYDKATIFEFDKLTNKEDEIIRYIYVD